MDAGELAPGAGEVGQPDFVAVDVRRLPPDKYGKFLVYLADAGIPQAPLPGYLTEAIDRLMVADAEGDRTPDFITKQQFLDGIEKRDEEENLLRTMGPLWQHLWNRRKWALWMIENRSTEAQGAEITLLADLFVELPGEDGPEFRLDAGLLYYYIQTIPREVSRLRLGDVRGGRLLTFLEARYKPSSPEAVD